MGEDVANDGGVFKTNDGPARDVPGTGRRTRRSARTGSSASRSGCPSPDCVRSSRSCSATSCRLPATRSSTSCRSSASCPAASARCPSRCGRSAAATGRFGTQHSATGESWFMAFPGLLVATAGTAAGGVRRAPRGDPPRRSGSLLRAQGPLRPQGPGRARRRQRSPRSARRRRSGAGSDVTIVATLLMVDRALRRGRALAERRDRGGGDRPALAPAARLRRPCARASRRQGGCWSSRSRFMPAAGAPASSLVCRSRACNSRRRRASSDFGTTS